MTYLIYVYDAIKQLNKAMLGTYELHDKKGGVLGALDRVFDVIENGVSSKIRLRGEDEVLEYVFKILDNPNLPPEERAKMMVNQGKSL